MSAFGIWWLYTRMTESQTSSTNPLCPFVRFHSKAGVLLTYHIIVRGLDINMNKSRVLTNVTIDAATPTLLLANLTEGVTYTVSVAAGNRAGLGPYNSPATLRLDPITKRLDQTASHRFVLHFPYIDEGHKHIAKKNADWKFNLYDVYCDVLNRSPNHMLSLILHVY